MKENAKEYLFLVLQRQIPFFATLFFLFFEYAAIGFGRVEIRPMLGISAVFFWLFNRPDIFNLRSVAVLGIVCDFLSYAPMGLYLFSFLLMYVLEMKISKYISNKLFVVNFFSFALLLAAIVVAQWLLLTIYYRNIIPFSLIFVSWIITVCLYPLITSINLYVAKIFIPEEDFLDG